MSLTLKLGKRGRFSKVSKGYMFSGVPVAKTCLVW